MPTADVKLLKQEMEFRNKAFEDFRIQNSKEHDMVMGLLKQCVSKREVRLVGTVISVLVGGIYLILAIYTHLGGK